MLAFKHCAKCGRDALCRLIPHPVRRGIEIWVCRVQCRYFNDAASIRPGENVEIRAAIQFEVSHKFRE